MSYPRLWFALVLLLMASCVRYEVPKFEVGRYVLLDATPPGGSVVLIDGQGWSSVVTRSKGSRYRTGEALVANLTTALSTAFARVRFGGSAAPGNTADYTLEVRLGDLALKERGLMSNLDLTLQIDAVFRDPSGRKLLEKSYTADCQGAGEPRAALGFVLDDTITRVTRSLLEDVRAALGRNTEASAPEAPSAEAGQPRLLVLPPVCDPTDERLSRALHGVQIREAEQRPGVDVVPEVEVERALRSAEGRALVGCAEQGCAVHAAGLVEASSVLFGTVACASGTTVQPVRWVLLDAVTGKVEREHEGTLEPTPDPAAHEAHLLQAARAAVAALLHD